MLALTDVLELTLLTLMVLLRQKSQTLKSLLEPTRIFTIALTSKRIPTQGGTLKVFAGEIFFIIIGEWGLNEE